MIRPALLGLLACGIAPLVMTLTGCAENAQFRRATYAPYHYRYDTSTQLPMLNDRDDAWRELKFKSR